MKGSLLLLTAALLAAGCATTDVGPNLNLRYEDGLKSGPVGVYVAASGDRNIAVHDLGRTAWVSHHLVVVNGGEQPHYHRFHDLTVVVLEGRGKLAVEGRTTPMKVGDVAHIHRGTPHFFRNTGDGPAAALVIFSPPFDGHDRVPVIVEREERAPGAVQERKTEKRRWWQLF